MYDFENTKPPPKWVQTAFILAAKMLLFVACLGLFVGSVMWVWAVSIKFAPFAVIVSALCWAVFRASKQDSKDQKETDQNTS